MATNKEIKEISLENLGFNEFFASNRNQLGLDDFPVARVIAEYKGAYKVKNTEGEYMAKITGKHVFDASSREDYPAVGDWVAINIQDDQQATIHEVLPRQTIIKRKYGDKNRAGAKDKLQVIATNIDTAFVVESVDRDYSLNRFERYLAVAQDNGVKPAIVLNKIDLLSSEELDEKLVQLKSRFPDIDIILTSIINNQGLDELVKYILKGKTYCFLGSSGVGKSSLINKLLGEDEIKTGEISTYSGRGAHTTTSRQMYFLENGGIVIDNPGMREVDVSDVSEGVDIVFDEITALSRQCKFADCVHIHEPGCAVINAVESGELDKEKYLNYTTLKKEAVYREMNANERKEKDRKFGKFIKNAKKDLKKIGHKNY